jgi:UDP-GlcNAc3NAcA epimerase
MAQTRTEKRVLTIVGARPQFVKAAPVSAAIAAHPTLAETMVHTGQHFDAEMSAVFFDELGIPAPRYNLDIHSLGHGAMTGRMLEGIETILQQEMPDILLIYGDTNSTLAGALAAAKLHIPVAHIEAGLRSYNRTMPEEINRVMADHVSDLLFCPTQRAVDNLRSEGISSGVHHVGDVMFDATKAAIERAKGRPSKCAALGLAPGGYSVATIHRAENTDSPARFSKVLSWLAEAARTRPIVFPAHPRVRTQLQEADLPASIHVIGPLGYLDMALLVHESAGVFTDSGGLQKEAYFHGVPCVTLRGETEWVETIDAGWNRLWTQENSVAPRRSIGDYGDGNASTLIVDLVADFLSS